MTVARRLTSFKVRGIPIVLRLRSRPGRGWSRDQSGLCTRTSRGFTVDILLTRPEREVLEVLIHELLHAAYWDLDEHAVAETADDIAGILWRLGWRCNGGERPDRASRRGDGAVG